MKSIKGGDEFCGNIYCMVGGVQTLQGSGCGDDAEGNSPMDYAMTYCDFEDAINPASCSGCAQFPSAA